MKIRGTRTSRGAHVTLVIDGIEAEVLNPRFDLRNHSPTGFEWGYGGSGPAQLALAILARLYDDDELAQKYYQQFKFDVIAGLQEDWWELDFDTINTWLKGAREENK